MILTKSLKDTQGGIALPNGVSILLALLSSFLLFLASPGAVEFGYLAWIALIPFFLAIQGHRPRRAAFLGLCSGILYYLSILYWITIVLGRYGYLPWWVTSPALFLLALYMSLYFAGFAALISLLSRFIPLGFCAPIVWVALDLVRAKLFSGFPWMDLAYTQYRYPLVIQSADLFGHHGVTFLIVMCNALFFSLLMGGSRKRNRFLPEKRNAMLLPAAFVIIAATTYSIYRYRHIETAIVKAEKVPVAVIQGNIPQDKKWLPSFQKHTVDTYISLSEQALAQQKNSLLIWPETALPFYPLESTLFSTLIDTFIKQNKVTLLTGTPHRYKLTDNSPLRYFNSSFLISPSGVVTGKYDKQHLVPFGEYIPFRNLLHFAPLVETIGDFTPGPPAKPLAYPKGRIGVLICFESIFPELARDQVERGATLLANITNDAWFGRSSAPWQHLAMAVFRAVETRRSLARSANTGISGFIDPSGKLIKISPLFEPYFLTSRMPVLTETTFYVRLGHHFAVICLALLCLALLFTRKGPKKTSN